MSILPINSPFVFQRNYIKDDCLAEGRVTIPVVLTPNSTSPTAFYSIGGQQILGAGFSFNTQNIKSVYQVSGIKSVDFTIEFESVLLQGANGIEIFTPTLYIYCTDSGVLKEITPNIDFNPGTRPNVGTEGSLSGNILGSLSLISNTSATILIVAVCPTSCYMNAYLNFNNFERDQFLVTNLSAVDNN